MKMRHGIIGYAGLSKHPSIPINTKEDKTVVAKNETTEDKPIEVIIVDDEEKEKVKDIAESEVITETEEVSKPEEAISYWAEVGNIIEEEKIEEKPKKKSKRRRRKKSTVIS